MNRTLIVTIVVSLIVGIGGGYVFSYREIPGLQSEIGSLESEVSTLTIDYDHLDVAYNQLTTNYSDLNAVHNELQTTCNNLNGTYNQLLNDYDFLESEYESLNSSYNDLSAQYNILQSNYDSLNSTHDGLQRAYEELEEEAARLLVLLEEAEDRIAELEQMAEYEVHVLLDEEYYQHIKNDLEKANETILVAMYSMVYDPGDSFDWANDLIRELVYAKERGVNVTIIIENRTFFGYMGENLEAYNYLSAHNVTVRLDNETDTDHMKLVIIDDKIVYVGSHNWSESALYYNHETSVKIVSEDVAEIFKAYFGTI
jgi:predicted  nucleic acid-binding Zn-ribbon protein